MNALTLWEYERKLLTARWVTGRVWGMSQISCWCLLPGLMSRAVIVAGWMLPMASCGHHHC